MYDVTLDDIRERREKLEGEIANALNRFQTDTGVSVVSIAFDAVVDDNDTIEQVISIALDI